MFNYQDIYHIGVRVKNIEDAMEEMGIDMESKLEPTNPEYFDEELPASDQLHELVLDEIRSLPQMYKDVLTLREVEKKKYEEE